MSDEGIISKELADKAEQAAQEGSAEPLTGTPESDAETAEPEPIRVTQVEVPEKDADD